jgi:glycerophosphoryl diester phosphodiesterase
MHVFTINEEAEMMRLLQLGVDGIITDYPARLLTMLPAR